VFGLKSLFRGLRFGVWGSGFEAESLKFNIWFWSLGIWIVGQGKGRAMELGFGV